MQVIPQLVAHPTRGCAGDLVKMMNNKGADWCRENRTYILEELQARARHRELPWDAEAAAWIVNKAIEGELNRGSNNHHPIGRSACR